MGQLLGRRRLLVAVACAATFAALALAVGLRWTPLLQADQSFAARTHTWAASRHSVVRAAMLVSDVARPLTFQLAAAVIVVALLLRRRALLAVKLAMATLAAMALGSAFKALIHRPRPAFAHPLDHAHGWSFPSSHALTVATATAAYVLLLSDLGGRSRLRSIPVVAGTVLAATVAASRVVLGVHYLSDVLAGLLLGVALSCASFGLWSLAERSD